jgi:hypothetical protein
MRWGRIHFRKTFRNATRSRRNWHFISWNICDALLLLTNSTCALAVCWDYDVRSLSWQHKIKMADFNGGQRFWTFQILVTPWSLIMFAWNLTNHFWCNNKVVASKKGNFLHDEFSSQWHFKENWLDLITYLYRWMVLTSQGGEYVIINDLIVTWTPRMCHAILWAHGILMTWVEVLRASWEVKYKF